jgi:small subunit ribosomal protein S9
MADQVLYQGLGRRKSATARVRLSAGKGVVTINDQPAEEYLDGNKRLLWQLSQPLETVDMGAKYNVQVKVSGGGNTGQIDAITLGIGKALIEMNPDLRPTLKRAGFLKRDSREKERKKYGLKGARKKEQFSKR